MKFPHQDLSALESVRELKELPANIGNALTCLYLEVYTRESIIVRQASWGKTIYGTWDALVKDIPNMQYYVNVIIKVY